MDRSKSERKAFNIIQFKKPNQKMSLLVPPKAASTTHSSTHSRPVLGPGYGLTGWIRFNRRSLDLSGTHGAILKVTPSQLATHNTEEDAWTVFQGKVYNITPYLKYHPGGVSELMKGAGKDCTEMFQQVHSYVQLERFLSKCFVGHLVQESFDSLAQPTKNSSVNKGHRKHLSVPALQQAFSAHTLAPPLQKSPISEDPDEPFQVTTISVDVSSGDKEFSSTATPDSGIDDEYQDSLPLSVEGVTSKSPKQARYQFYQDSRRAVITVFTYLEEVKPSNTIVDIADGCFHCTITLKETVYELKWKLNEGVTRTSVASEGMKIIITLQKKSDVMWPDPALSSDMTEKHSTIVSRVTSFRRATLTAQEEVSHDTKIFSFSLPPGSYMNIPTGHHVQLEALRNGKQVIRSYTPVRILNNAAEQFDMIHFMIKLYPDGEMSQILSRLVIGDSILISDPCGDFKTSLSNKKKVFMMSAGTGFTPMSGIIHDMFVKKSQDSTEGKLFFANKSERDILWKHQLESLQEKTDRRFQVVNVLSQADESWNGLSGRIDKEFLSSHLPDPNHLSLEETLICVCGMIQFTSSILEILVDLGYPDECVYAFT